MLAHHAIFFTLTAAVLFSDGFEAPYYEYTEEYSSSAEAVESHDLGKRANEPALWNATELPGSNIPLLYVVLWRWELDIMQVYGQVVITILVAAPESYMVLHLFPDSEITRLELNPSGSTEVLATERDVVYMAPNEQILIRCSRTLQAGEELMLTIHYQAPLSSDYEGVFLSRHYDGNGGTTDVVGSQFETVAARMALPCFDEPKYKAKFRISVIRPADWSARSSMSLKKTTSVMIGTKNMVRDDFYDSPPIPPHAVAFVTYPTAAFATREIVTTDGTKISFCAPKDNIQEVDLALNVATQCLSYLRELGISYPVPELKFMVIPGNALISHGFGLKMGGTIDLLYSSEYSSEAQKQEVVFNVFYQIMRELFGNVVTAESWNCVWIPNAVAMLLARNACKSFYPTWRCVDELYLSAYVTSMRYDSQLNSRPLTPSGSIVTPDDIDSMGSDTRRGKAAAVMRQIFRHADNSQLSISLKAFLEKFRYRNFGCDDFFGDFGSLYPGGPTALQADMSVWTKQVGYPVVHVSYFEDGGWLAARQKRFSNANLNCPADGVFFSNTSQASYGSVSECEGKSYALCQGDPCSAVWPIYLECDVVLSDGTAKKVSAWLRTSSEVKISLPGSIAFVKCNSEAIGFFRVSYSYDLRNRLLAAMQQNPSQFSSVERASFIGDAYALTWSKQNPGDIEHPIALTAAVLPDCDHLILSVAMEEICNLVVPLMESDMSAAMKMIRFVGSRLNIMAQKLGWSSIAGTHEENLARSAVLEYSVTTMNNNVTTDGGLRCDDWITNGAPLNSNTRMAMWMSGFKNKWDLVGSYIWEYFTVSDNPADRQDILRAVGRGASRANYTWVLNKSLEPGIMSPQDLACVLKHAFKNPEACREVLQFLYGNWAAIYGALPSGILGAILRDAVAAYTTETGLQNSDSIVGGFIQSGLFSKVEHCAQQGQELARLRKWWAETYRADLAKTLTARGFL